MTRARRTTRWLAHDHTQVLFETSSSTCLRFLSDTRACNSPLTSGEDFFDYSPKNSQARQANRCQMREVRQEATMMRNALLLDEADHQDARNARRSLAGGRQGAKQGPLER